MDLLETIRKRKTTNTPFLPRRLSDEHKRLLIEAASRAPSHFNSQPWRFIIVEDKERIQQIANIAGDSMKHLMEDGSFVARYRRYFRFSERESTSTGSGIYIDNVPAVLRPMAKMVFSEQVGSLLGKLGAASILGGDQRKIVNGAPMLMAITLDKQEYKLGELSGLYASITLGAVIQTLWLVTTAMEIGMQFISTPLEVPANKSKIMDFLAFQLSMTWLPSFAWVTKILMHLATPSTGLATSASYLPSWFTMNRGAGVCLQISPQPEAFYGTMKRHHKYLDQSFSAF